MSNDIYEAYVEAYMKTNRCSRDVAIASINKILTLVECDKSDD